MQELNNDTKAEVSAEAGNESGNEDNIRMEDHTTRVTSPVSPVRFTESAEPRQPSRRLAWVATSIIVASVLITAIIIQTAYNRSYLSVPELPPSRALATVDMPSPADLSKSFREIAKAVKPALVYIESQSSRRGSGEDEAPGFPFQNPRREASAGSGFIVTDDGYILTNNHVIENSDRLEVTLSDGRKLRAIVVGTDPATDLAVIKINATGLPIAILGNSDEVEQGDWVVALGSPFGLQQTLTAGVVSATGRELQQSQFSRFIQTDASINPGNSGGPLVSMQGEVVGINTMIIRSPFSQGNVGIGFAIASNNARDVFGQLVRAGRVSRGYLGVTIADLDEARARSLGVERDSGVLVQDVPDPNTPAGKAGLISGDIITAFDGKRVRSQRELTNLVAAQPVGKSVRVDFLRGGQTQSVTVELAERPDTITARQVTPVPEEEVPGSSLRVLGVVARSVDQEIASRMNLRVPTGALVVSVTQGSPAAEAQLEHGDIIHRIDRTEVKTVEDLVEASKSLKSDDEVAVQIEKGGRLYWVTLRIE